MPTEPIRISLSVPYPADEAAQGALEVCRRLREHGHTSWLAGGCVRDLLRRVAIKDFDIASEASPAEVQRIFRRTVAVGEAFGVVRVLGEGASPAVWEVAQFRAESGYSDGRHPDSVRPGTPAEDAARRDFTINGLFLDPVGLVVIDHVGGLADLQAGLVRAIGDPTSRFGEDYLRMLRAVRFVAATGFALDAPTASAVQALAGRIVGVSAERVADELRRTLGSPRGVRGLELLQSLGLSVALFPGLAPADADGMSAVTSQAHACALECPGDWLGPLAALLDSDPVAPRPIEVIVDSVQGRLRLSRHELADLRDLLACRRELGVLPASVAGDKRLARRAGFARALALLSGDPRAGAAERAHSWRSRTAAWTEESLNPPAFLSGSDLIAAGVPRGPAVGELLRALEDAQLEGEVTDLASAKAWVEARRREAD